MAINDQGGNGSTQVLGLNPNGIKPTGTAQPGQVWNAYLGVYQSQADYDAWQKASQPNPVPQNVGAEEGWQSGQEVGLSDGFSRQDQLNSQNPNVGQTYIGAGGRFLGLVGGAVAGGPLGAIAGYKTGGALADKVDGATAQQARDNAPGGSNYTPSGAYKPVQINPGAQLGSGAFGTTPGTAGLSKPGAGAAPGATGVTTGALTSAAPGTGTTTADLAKAYYDQKSRPAPTLAPAARASAATATAPTVGPAALGTAGTATAATAGKSTVDQTAANGTRTQQEDAISNLVAAANGTKPSAAELQLKQSTDRAVANQLALASAVQGRSVGGALKQASDQAGAISAQGDSDAAILRAKEQADARSALASTLQGVRGQDIDVASTDATLGNAVNITNANNATTTSGVNAKLATDTSNSNAAGINTLTGKQADVRSAAALTNANNATNVSETNASEADKVALAQADNELRARGLDDTQRAQILQQMVASKGQDLNYSGDVMRNNTALTLGAGDLDIRNRALALSGDTANWNKYKDVISGLGAGASALGTSDFLKNYLSGSSSPAPTYDGTDTFGGGDGTTSGVDYSSTDNVDEWGNPIGEGSDF